jgi:hypothetical protein
MSDVVLTPEQEAEAQRLAEIIGKKAQEEALQIARLLASKPDAPLLGATEFEVRDRVHELGAFALETALKERKKGGTKGRRNLHRMDYPTYLRRGWEIATGAVESACKTVVNQRLCMGGMRWGEEGSDAVAHLRALYRSDPDQWDGFWRNAA